MHNKPVPDVVLQCVLPEFRLHALTKEVKVQSSGAVVNNGTLGYIDIVDGC